VLQAVYTKSLGICCGFAPAVLKLNFGFPNLAERGPLEGAEGGSRWQMGISDYRIAKPCVCYGFAPCLIQFLITPIGRGCP